MINILPLRRVQPIEEFQAYCHVTKSTYILELTTEDKEFIVFNFHIAEAKSRKLYEKETAH